MSINLERTQGLPITYVSRTLTPFKRKASSYELKCLAVVYSIRVSWNMHNFCWRLITRHSLGYLVILDNSGRKVVQISFFKLKDTYV